MPEVYVYNPLIKIAGSTYQMPTPLRQVDDRYSNRIKQVEIPLRDGVIVVNVTRGSMFVSFDGLIHKDTRDAVLAEKDLLTAFLTGSKQSLDFYTYYAPPKARWYPNAYCTDLSFSRSSVSINTLPYQFTLLVPGGRECVS